MEIEKIARKLEPLMPDKMGHWLKVRETCDTKLKELIDKHVASLGHKTLGDLYNKILLSLPPRNTARGTFNFGQILYEKEKWPAGISENELLQNLAIFGRSGAGKTNVAFHVLEQLVEKKIPFLFLDWKRTGRHLLPHLKKPVKVFTPGRSLSPFPFNPFIPPPGLDRNLHINNLIDVMASAYTLGDGARSILQKTITEFYEQNECPTVSEILSIVENMELKGRAGGWRISAVRALQSLKFADISGNEKTNQNDIISTLTKSNTIIELDGLNQGAKKFLIPMLCLWLYYYYLGQSDREKLKLVVFMEEAHHVFYRQEQRARESVMDMLIRQCREIGMALVVVDQHPHLISSAALGNTYTTICLNLKDPTDINKASGLTLLEDNEKKYFSMLPVGHSFCS